MPFVLDRRSFLKQSVGLAAGFAAAWRLQGANGSSAKWALLSDTHVPADPTNSYRGFHSYDNAKKAFAQVAAGGPFDTVFVNGDLARLEGKTGDYENFMQLAAAVIEKHPLAVTLGNHDNRKNVQAAFQSLAGAPQPVKNKLVSVMDAGPVRFLLMDSLMETNHVPGLLGKAQRDWLRTYLATAGNKPVILFFHHNPGDGDGALLDTDRLFAILKPHRSVKAVVFGHTHTYRFAKQGNLHLINLPAVGYNFADAEPVGWVEGTFSAKGAEFKLRAIAGETKDDGKITSVEWV